MIMILCIVCFCGIASKRHVYGINQSGIYLNGSENSKKNVPDTISDRVGQNLDSVVVKKVKNGYFYNVSVKIRVALNKKVETKSGK